MALIGLISDMHAAPQPAAEALAIFSKAGVNQVLFAGDILLSKRGSKEKMFTWFMLNYPIKTRLASNY